MRGRVFMYEGDHRGAVAELRAAARAAPREAEIRVALLEALFRAGQRNAARECAELAQRRFPHDAGIWRVSGRINYSLGLLEPARRTFARAVELDDRDERAYLGLASTWKKLGRWEKAEEIFRKLLAVMPDSVSGNYRLAEALMRRHAYREAEPYLRRVLEIEPDHIGARVALARAAHERGEKQRSIAILRNAFDRSGGDPDVGEELFRQLLEFGDRRGALDLLDVLDRDDLDAQARVAFGYLYLQVGEPTAALELASRIREAEPRSGDVELLRANALVDLRRNAEAIETLVGVPPERPAYPECMALAGELLARQGDFSRALTVVEEARKRHPHHVGLTSSQALVYQLRGDAVRARRVFDSALEAEPGDTNLFYAYAELEDRLGNADRAVRLMEKVLAKQPDSAHAMNFIGYSLAERGVELDRAQRLLERAVELAPWNAYILDSYGWLKFRQKRLDEATALLGRAARLAPVEPEILFHLSELCRARNQRARALKLLEKALEHARPGALRGRIEARIRELRGHK